jgi:agmatinase
MTGPGTFLGVGGMGEVTDLAAVIVGAPVVSPYPGQVPHAVEAPMAIRAAARRMAHFIGHHDFDTGTPFAAWHARVADGGDLPTDPSDDAGNRAVVTGAIREALMAGALPILLGGDDSTGIPFLAAWEGRGPVTVVQLDAHLDFRDEVGGFGYGYSSPMRRASEMAWVRRVIHLGQRGVGSARPTDVRDSLAAGNIIVPARELQERGASSTAALLGSGEPFVLVLDVDGIDPTQVPAVRAPVPSGPGLAFVHALFTNMIARGSFRGLVITELEPSLDVNGISSLAMVRLMCRVLDEALS